MRILSKKKVIVSASGGRGIGFNTGSETASMAFALPITKETGEQTELQEFTQVTSLPIGTDTSTQDAPSLTGEGTHQTGSDTSSQNLTALPLLAGGTETDSFTADATAQISQFTTATAQSPGVGSVTWQTITNAQGAINGTEASYSVSAGLTGSNERAILKCSGLIVPATPSGFTRTKVEIVIVHRWDLVIQLPLVDTARYIAAVYDASSVVIPGQPVVGGFLWHYNDDNGPVSQSTLLQEVFDITSLVSDAQLTAGIQLWCEGTAVFATAAGGNMSIQIDAVHLRGTFTRTGIS